MKTKLFSFAMVLCSLLSFSQRLDVTFGIGGKLNVPEISNYGGFFLQTDGKFIISGSTVDNKGIIVRFHPSGTYDNTFGTNGKLIIDDANSLIRPTVINDGSIIVFANSTNTNNLKFRKISSNGTLDQSYTNHTLHPWFKPGEDGNSRFVVFSDGRITYGLFYRFYWNPGPGGEDVHQIGSINPNGTLNMPSNLYLQGQSPLNSSIDLHVQNFCADKQTGEVYVINNKQNYKLYKTSNLTTAVSTLSPDPSGSTSLLGGLKFVGGSLYYRGQNILSTYKTFTNKFIPATKLWENNEVAQASVFVSVDLSMQSDGKIIQLNRSGNTIQFARIKTDRTTDGTFGLSGKFELNPGIGIVTGGICEYDPITDRIYALVKGSTDDQYVLIRVNQTLTMSTTDVNKVKLEIFPNPTKITINFSKEIKSAEIYSLEGRKMMNNIQGKSANLSKLENGTYLIKGTDKEGNAFSEKVIKN